MWCRSHSQVRRLKCTAVCVALINAISGDFPLYDHVLDHSAALNVITKRYLGHNLSRLDVYSAMGRGRQADGVDVPASEMKKWYVILDACAPPLRPHGLP